MNPAKRPKQSKPKVFLGSSTEGLTAARALCMNLEHVAEVSVWTNNIFRLSRSTMHSLYETLTRSQFGVFLLTPDDIVKSRSQSYSSPRDNVIFELGLFAGRLGLEKTFIVHPRDIRLKLPTDLLGISTATYEEHSSGNWSATLNAASAKIINELEEHSLSVTHIDVSWDDLCNYVRTVGEKLRISPHSGGFMPDMIVGISRGGIIIADLLSRYLGGRIPTICLWADRYHNLSTTSFDASTNFASLYFKNVLQTDGLNNILVVDDISRTGATLSEAVDYIRSISASHNIRSLVLVSCTASKFNPDYCAFRTEAAHLRLPFSTLG